MLGGFVIVAAAALAGGNADEPICADRPGAANPSCIVPVGRIQVETGLVGWSRDRSGGVTSDELMLGETAVKYGVSDRLHVEVDVAPFVRARVRDGSSREGASGFGDLGLAAKVRLTGADSAVGASLYPFMKLPTASRRIGNGKAEGGVALLVDGPFGSSGLAWNIAPEIDLVADGDGHGYHWGMVQVLSIGAGLSDRASAAVDLAASWDWDPDGTVRTLTIGPSAAYLLSSDVQIDAGIDIGLNRAATDIGLYSGISFRF